MQPIIRWAGSKKQILQTLEAHLPNSYNTYYEPFFGSGCLFFRLLPAKAILGDFNTDLINFYATLRKIPDEVHHSAIRFHREPSDYYRLRGEFPKTTDPKRRAALFYYLNRFSFNAIFRTNRSGVYNVPYGTRTGTFPTLSCIRLAAKQLKLATLKCTDFEKTLSTATKGDFVYLDPPYIYSSRKDRGEYGAGSFGTSDLERLAKTLTKLNSLKVRFMLSYIECEDIKSIAKKYSTTRIPVKRCVASLTSARKTVNELIIKNY